MKSMFLKFYDMYNWLFDHESIETYTGVLSRMWITTVLAWLWSIAFGLYIGSVFIWAWLVHFILLFMVFFTAWCSMKLNAKQCSWLLKLRKEQLYK